MTRIVAYSLAALVIAAAIVGCGRKSVRIVNKVKEIPISGGRDTVYFERSSAWDRGRGIARSDSNRQTITIDAARMGGTAYVTLENMGGVPLKRDTVRSPRREPAEHYLQTGTLDTNMHLHIEFPDWKQPSTDVVVYIRNRDSVYKEVLIR